METTSVKTCGATECAYNTNSHCHALAITVGDGLIAHCDTFCLSSAKGGEMTRQAQVGACKVAGCKHNQSLICHAHMVQIGHVDGEVRCLSYHAA